MKPQDVQQRDEDVRILDVREPHEWAAGHIEGALHIPMDQVPTKVDDLKGSRYITVCRSGSRSDSVMRFLKSKGIEAENLDGGLKAWAKRDLPLVSDEGPGKVV